MTAVTPCVLIENSSTVNLCILAHHITKSSCQSHYKQVDEQERRHERRTGCLAPPPLPNSEVSCQVERGEEVVRTANKSFFSILTGLSGVQGEVWTGKGQSLILRQVASKRNSSKLASFGSFVRKLVFGQFFRCERDRSGWEARWSRLLLPCRPSCRFNLTIIAIMS